MILAGIGRQARTRVHSPAGTPLTRLWIRAAVAEQAAPVTAGLSDIDDAERAGELLSPTLREDTSGEAVLVTRRHGVI